MTLTSTKAWKYYSYSISTISKDKRDKNMSGGKMKRYESSGC